jgi:hypothetical protein
MAVPRAGELVAEVSAAEAEGRSEVDREVFCCGEDALYVCDGDVVDEVVG